MSGLVIIGASYAGLAGAAAAREAGYGGPIYLVTDEDDLPYQRPPLSKGFVSGAVTGEELALRDQQFFDSNAIEFLPSRRAETISTRDRRVYFDGGSHISFSNILLATGSRPRRMGSAPPLATNLCYLRSMKDAENIREKVAFITEVLIIGGGFIGLELAASLCKLGKSVTVLDAAGRLLERAVSPAMSRYLLDMHRSKGVTIHLDQTITRFKHDGSSIRAVELASGKCLEAELIIVGIGGVANQELAAEAGALCSNGIDVDRSARSSLPQILAAGDCATYTEPRTGVKLRLESVQHAQDQGRVAGLTVAGRNASYESVPRFWSDQYDAKLQMCGLSAGADEAVVRGNPEEGRFTSFFFKQGQFIGAESVNRAPEQLACRKLLSQSISPTREQAADPAFNLNSLCA